MDNKERRVGAGYFKQHCLAIIDEVAEMHQPVVITKRGKPMAKLVPVAADEEIERHILARLRAGEGGMRVDEKTFLEPSSRIAGWSET
jgi:prevent-host-death family protein